MPTAILVRSLTSQTGGRSGSEDLPTMARYRNGVLPGRVRRAVVATAGILVLAGACRQSPAARDAQVKAGQIADHTPSPDQARLWREAAAKGLGAGLEKIPVANPPIDVPQRAPQA